MIIHIPTKRKYKTKMDAKIVMGNSNYNKALENGEFIIVHEATDIII